MKNSINNIMKTGRNALNHIWLTVRPRALSSSCRRGPVRSR